MASKIKVDELETADGTGTIALQNQISGMTSASMPTGSVLQVVSTTIATSVTTTSSSYVAVTGVTANITPSATTSKILIMVSGGDIDNQAAGGEYDLSIYKGGSNISTNLQHGYDNASRSIVSIALSFLDSPSSTSTLTYDLRFKAVAGTIAANNQGAKATITLMEIAG